MNKLIMILSLLCTPILGMNQPCNECHFDGFIGSVDEYMCIAQQSIFSTRTKRDGKNSLNVFLLQGKSGTGKKTFAYTFAKTIEAKVFHVDVKALAAKGSRKDFTILHGVMGIYEEAIKYHKSTGKAVVIILENVEVCSGIKEYSTSEDQLQSSKSLNISIDQCKGNPNIITFLLTDSNNIKDQIVSRSQVINWPLPDTQNRQELFVHFLKSHPHELSKDLLPVLVQFTQNFAGGDIEKAVTIAHQLAQKDSSSKIKDEHIWEGLFQAMETNDRIAKISISHHKRLLMLKHLDNAQKLHASQTSLLVLARLTPCFSSQDLSRIIDLAQKNALANKQSSVKFSNLMDGFTQALGANTQLIKTYAMRTGLTILGTIVSAYMIIKGGPVIIQKLFAQTPPPRANG